VIPFAHHGETALPRGVGGPKKHLAIHIFWPRKTIEGFILGHMFVLLTYINMISKNPEKKFGGAMTSHSDVIDENKCFPPHYLIFHSRKVYFKGTQPSSLFTKSFFITNWSSQLYFKGLFKVLGVLVAYLWFFEVETAILRKLPEPLGSYLITSKNN